MHNPRVTWPKRDICQVEITAHCAWPYCGGEDLIIVTHNERQDIWDVETDCDNPLLDQPGHWISIAKQAIKDYDGPPDDPDGAWSGGIAKNH